ncbi:hypothetical protein BJY24_007680 [Nocardia transvalensis]|uniref:Uncharacterized protein n=1 Tax=Nocardia transvalensis TaxID=37333 RepID=A0A7W9UML8_9NOCA|nr:hypothetical protein [Nocardia transvalensis]MBB5918768.1 hypothetical protein [Nocardia transvalensis]
MTEAVQVTVADTIRWLHEEGLTRLVGVAGRTAHPVSAYTVDIATGTVTVYPAAGGGVGSDVTTLAADDLPHPASTSKRLVIVGVTTAESVLVVDLSACLDIGINAKRPEAAARSWALQLLLNPEITIVTNSDDLALGDSPRLRQSFIPGGGATIVSIDDEQPPVTTVTFNPTVEMPDRLDVMSDGAGEVYLGARFWRLRQVLTIADAQWQVLAAEVAPDDDAAQQDSFAPPGRASVSAPDTSFDRSIR